MSRDKLLNNKEKLLNYIFSTSDHWESTVGNIENVTTDLLISKATFYRYLKEFILLNIVIKDKTKYSINNECK